MTNTQHSKSRYEDKLEFDTHRPKGVEEDHLGFKVYAESIHSVLAKVAIRNTGLTFGVFGGWGTGKSSILRMTKQILNTSDKRKFLVVEFDAWLYVKQEELWIALLRRITSEVGVFLRKDGWNWWLHQLLYKLKLMISKIAAIKLIVAVAMGAVLGLGAGASFLVLTKPDEIIQIAMGLVIVVLVLYVLWMHLLPSISFAVLNFNLWLNRVRSNPLMWRNLSLVIEIGVLLGMLIGGSVVLHVLTGLEQIIRDASIFSGSALVVYVTMKVFESILGKWQGKINIIVPSLARLPFDHNRPLVIDSFREDFSTVVKSVCYDRTIVVLIDNLDRCLPDQVVPVLESIQHLGLDDEDIENISSTSPASPPLIAFVLAADRQSIERAVLGHFKNHLPQMSSDESERFAREYIEKIVQFPFDLPPLTRGRLQQLLSQ